jgi:hypothetical protein
LVRANADQDRNPGIEQAVDDELGRLERHPLKILQGVFYGKRCQGPALAEGIERDAEVGDEGQDEDQPQEKHHPRPGRRGELLALDHGIGQRAVVLDRDILLGDDQKKNGENHHDG